MRLHRSPTPPSAGTLRRAIAAAAVMLAATTAACASQQQPGQSAGRLVTTTPIQASDIRTPQSSSPVTPDGVLVTLPGETQAAPTPRTLPCLSGTATVQLNADGTDPTTICAHLGADITLHLPPPGPGPWSAPTASNTRTITVTSTPTSPGGLNIHVRADAPGTSQISTHNTLAPDEEAPGRTWTATITVVP